MQTYPSWRFSLPVFAQVTGLLLAIGCLYGMPELSAEDMPKAANEKAAHYERMLHFAQSFQVFEVKDDQPVPARLINRPVLAYRDDTRKQHDSTLWIFGTDGRPSAMISIENYPQRPKSEEWLFEVASLSAGLISVERSPELKWQSRQPGLMFRELADAPAPAEKPSARLAQMRQLRLRFAAHEREGTNGRVELQALSAPLYRYQDEKLGIVDGAMFAFANGTNPEVLWIIEAYHKPGTEPCWQFALAQMTGAEVFMALDGKEIWTRGEAYPPADQDSYMNRWISAAPKKLGKSD